MFDVYLDEDEDEDEDESSTTPFNSQDAYFAGVIVVVDVLPNQPLLIVVEEVDGE